MKAYGGDDDEDLTGVDGVSGDEWFQGLLCRTPGLLKRRQFPGTCFSNRFCSDTGSRLLYRQSTINDSVRLVCSGWDPNDEVVRLLSSPDTRNP